MKAEIIDEKGRHIKIHITETDAAQVNAIRRTILSDVPKMAISKVRFELGQIQDQKGEYFESVNALPDEVIAHRLAMIPIPTFLDEFVFPDEDPANQGLPEDQWGSPASQIIYHCSVRGPSLENKGESKTVYASDLNVLGETKLQIAEEHHQIPLTTLMHGQYLEFYAYATLGRGKEHAKYAPASAIAFHQREKAVIKNKTRAKVLYNLDLGVSASDFNKDGVVDDFEKVEKIRKALAQVGQGTGRDGDFNDAKGVPAIVIEKVAGEYIFTFESDGSFPPAEIFNQACTVLSERFDGIGEELATVLA
ncbi:MAG: DNA-directed RNA polymerase subunit D [Candidatus Poseidoniaceae archaeon]|jgi:DNA-directed RNA polymerase subunit D|nr:DNA-directed RNA polymerase subunit D [Candidatus Poseidoniaceae archaeon]MDP7202841.1 DNA-directed RNA polymerase subunit D [Candidatus Poseidoniaceae archaeon]